MPPKTLPEKRVRLTTVKDQPERSVRDFLAYRPAPFAPPPAPVATEKGGYEDMSRKYQEYCALYRIYLAKLAELRKDFSVVFLQGGNFEMTVAEKEPVPVLTREERSLLPAESQRKVVELSARVAKAEAATFPTPIVSVTPRPAKSPEELQALAEKRRIRRRNANARRRSRKAALKREAATADALEKVAELQAKSKLARAEATWTKVLSRAEKSEARKAKRAGLVPAQMPTPAAAPGVPSAPRLNRAQRRWAIYGPPTSQ